jgi:hypothetical protein
MTDGTTTAHPILPFITITTKFLSKHCIKRVLDTEMNGYHCFNFTEKLSYLFINFTTIHKID